MICTKYIKTKKKFHTTADDDLKVIRSYQNLLGFWNMRTAMQMLQNLKQLVLGCVIRTSHETETPAARLPQNDLMLLSCGCLGVECAASH